MAQLTRDEIIEAALALFDQGPEALTMRSLADQLGVTAAALYYWFPAKAHLIDAIAEYVAAQIIAAEHRGGSWQDRLRELATGILDAAEHHPATFSFVFRKYATQPPLATMDEAILDILLDAGFDERDAVLAKNAILRFVLGEVDLAHVPTHIDPSTVDVAAYPRAHQVSKASARLTSQDYLDYGLDHLIASLKPTSAVHQRNSRRVAAVRTPTPRKRAAS
jgi:TetR/AcrR family tetracycline transcriptional repressor